ncbi:alpha/beta fold hydrolase [Burkholderia stagnalis]|uniref:alpha/beta fold hydrolase n=1 Tax=Burkholderia stagnalis TaxID=1503054 RepID=UPI0021AB4BD1|nr:alpha/beta hydrolase [Burkholderia stagnalis]
MKIDPAPIRPGFAGVTRRQFLVIGAGTAAAVALPFAAAAAPTAPNGAETPEGNPPMSYITTKDGVQIFYKDLGPSNGTPIVFSHGWPLSSDDWDAQMMFF